MVDKTYLEASACETPNPALPIVIITDVPSEKKIKTIQIACCLNNLFFNKKIPQQVKTPKIIIPIEIDER